MGEGFEKDNDGDGGIGFCGEFDEMGGFVEAAADDSDETFCAETDCPSSATGACCYKDGKCEDGVTQKDCESLDGKYRGDGTTCATDPCDVETLQACCFIDGSCGT